MSRHSSKHHQMPTTGQIETELKRERKSRQFGSILRSTIYILVTVAAFAILVATIFLPVMRIYGSSMAPTIKEGEIVVGLKGAKFKPGDIIAFYYNNKVLVKRVICGPGDWITIQEDGTVIVNDEVLEEPYLIDRSFGICDLEFPYQVPASQYFVMGDQRSVSVDSRSSTVGCIAEEQIVGRIALCVWPLKGIRFIR